MGACKHTSQEDPARLTYLLEDAELLRVSAGAGGGAGRRNSQEPRLSAATPTGWLRAVARAARRFCLPRQGGLEPVALSWATSSARLATTTPRPFSARLFLETSAGKAIQTESVGRRLPHGIEPAPCHNGPKQGRGWGLEASAARAIQEVTHH